MGKINKESYRQNYILTNSEVNTLMFSDTEPNSCIFQNISDTKIYISRSPNVSDKKYECLVYPNATCKFVKPRQFRYLYFYSEEQGNLNVESFVTEDLTPKDLQSTETVNFLELKKPVSLGNITEIEKPIVVKDFGKYIQDINEKREKENKEILKAIVGQNIDGIINAINGQDLTTIVEAINNKKVDLNPILSAIKENAPKDIKIDFSEIVNEIKGLRKDLGGVNKFMSKIVYTAEGEIDLDKLPSLKEGSKLIDKVTKQEYEIIVEDGKPSLVVVK